MIKYIVAEIETVNISEDECEEYVTNVELHPCADTRAILAAVDGVVERDNDWNVFEFVNGKMVRRSIVFKYEDKKAVDVAIAVD